MTDIQKENKSGGKVPNRGSVNFPRLRFPEFEGEYRQYSFEDLFLFSTGKNIKQNEASPEYETPCVRYGELYHLYNEIISEVVNKTNLDKSDLTFSIGNEILLPSAGEDPLDIGSASALTIKGVAIGRTINILRPLKKNLYSNIYVSYYINEKLKKKISTLAKGVSISNVYNSDLKILNALLPSISEQQKISSFLLLINSRIQTQNKIIEQIEFYFKGIKDTLFSQKIRFGGFAEDWETKKLGDVLLKNSTKNKNQKYSTVQSVSNKYGFINQEDIFEDRRVASVDTSNYYVIDKGCFAYNPSRINVGSLAYKFDDEISIISPLYISFKAENIFLIDTFLLYWFKTIEFTKQMNNSFEGSVRNTLSYENLIKMNISIPSLEEQIQISSFLTKIDQKIQTEKTILEQLETQKKYLLQQMFV
ncbi:restriction endonuclease subunit S [Chryseobacterium fistulae]|jgi:type I restriction enzyme S subunit|uniref:Type I restriction modification DNA specificity domain-containing protein n=1 Tax=Chryseobacterium fistulae TaxID=2675058 RepID=A0A6N4XS97_9FLAO|nr:restriction endonuclease subunit S [Chryseobacterium fistulae]CAA7392144.1 hypothetical protein CHRY9393_03050 [Chryseobacterium fistulae]